MGTNASGLVAPSRWIGVTAVAALFSPFIVLASCTAKPAADGDGTNLTDPSSCSTGKEGCPCDQEGQTADCGRVVQQSGDFVTCSMGHAQCSGGSWGACNGDHLVTKSVNVTLDTGGLHATSASVPCTDLCDPSCNSIQSSGSDVDAGAGLAISPEGGVCIGVDGGTCTAACVGLQCDVNACGGNPNLTTLTGTVHDPAGNNPIYNVIVSVPIDPTAALPAFVAGTSTAACGGAPLVTAVATTTTDANGNFTLTGVPSGVNVPVVLQSGKWRREILLASSSVSACAANAGPPTCAAGTPAGSCTYDLPKNRTDGWDPVAATYTKADMPKMAIVSGGADPFECLMLKIGISPNEFVDGANGAMPSNAVDFFQSPDATATIYGTRVTGDALYDASPSILPHYDAIFLPCEGSPYDKKGSAGVNPKSVVTPPVGVNPYANLISYMDGGGRAFSTHYSYTWLQYPSSHAYVAGPDNWSTVVTWSHRGDPQDPMTATVATDLAQIPASPKGTAFQNWLLNVGASTTAGQLQVHAARHDVDDTNDPTTEIWLNASDSANSDQYMPLWAFNTPYASGNTYGRVVYSDFHVSNAAITSGLLPGGAPKCFSNTDCGYGQTCGGGGGGTAGTCNEPCYQASDCANTSYTCTGSGGTCRMNGCKHGHDCHSNSCSGGKCQCSNGADCQSGTCTAGVCVETAGACVSDSACGPDESCDGVSLGACTKACTTDADCTAGKELCTGAAGAVSTTTTANYSQPFDGSTVTITVTTTAGFVVGQAVTVKAGAATEGDYTVTQVVSGTQLKLKRIDNNGVNHGTTVTSGKTVNGAANGGTCKGCYSAAECTSKCEGSESGGSCSAAKCTGAVPSGTCAPAMPAAPGGVTFQSSTSGSGPWGWFPYACQQSPLTAQEKALEFMVFDLTSCQNTTVALPTLSPQTFTQDYTSTCGPGTVTVWRDVDWQANIPASSTIVFKGQSGPDVAGLLPATPVLLATATTSTILPNYDFAIIDNSNGLGGPGTGPFNTAVPPVKSDTLLRITITLNPTADAHTSPVLDSWKVDYDCVADE